MDQRLCATKWFAIASVFLAAGAVSISFARIVSFVSENQEDDSGESYERGQYEYMDYL